MAKNVAKTFLSKEILNFQWKRSSPKLGLLLYLSWSYPKQTIAQNSPNLVTLIPRQYLNLCGHVVVADEAGEGRKKLDAGVDSMNQFWPVIDWCRKLVNEKLF
jgi:hypothetical protein